MSRKRGFKIADLLQPDEPPTKRKKTFNIADLICLGSSQARATTPGRKQSPESVVSFLCIVYNFDDYTLSIF
jgi:hypothetical protein